MSCHEMYTKRHIFSTSMKTQGFFWMPGLRAGLRLQIVKELENVSPIIKWIVHISICQTLGKGNDDPALPSQPSVMPVIAEPPECGLAWLEVPEVCLLRERDS